MKRNTNRKVFGRRVESVESKLIRELSAARKAGDTAEITRLTLALNRTVR